MPPPDWALTEIVTTDGEALAATAVIWVASSASFTVTVVGRSLLVTGLPVLLETAQNAIPPPAAPPTSAPTASAATMGSTGVRRGSLRGLVERGAAAGSARLGLLYERLGTRLRRGVGVGARSSDAAP